MVLYMFYQSIVYLYGHALEAWPPISRQPQLDEVAQLDALGPGHKCNHPPPPSWNSATRHFHAIIPSPKIILLEIIQTCQSVGKNDHWTSTKSLCYTYTGVGKFQLLSIVYGSNCNPASFGPASELLP